MGIGDRAYMRYPETPRASWPATGWTLGVLLFFFILKLIEESAQAQFLRWMPLNETQLEPWQFFTHPLLHENGWHLLANGLGLWWTGPLVENSYGKKIYWITLVAGSLGGALLWWITGLQGTHHTGLLGISAGVYALMTLALLDKLDQSITLLLFFFLPVNLRVRWLLALGFGYTLVSYIFAELPSRHLWPAWQMAWDSNVAHSAHLGGLIVGTVFFWKLNSAARPDWGFAVTTPSAPTPASTGGETSQASKNQAKIDLDILLDKISASGFGSLTPEEKRRLEELSARLR